MISVHPFIATLGLILLKIICLLVAIAYFTIAERKIRAAIQRRRGPNVVGAWGLLQPAADGLKLIAKERIIPSHANSRIFVIAPLVVLTLGLLTWVIIPFGVYDYSEVASASKAVRAVAYGVGTTPDFYRYNEPNTFADARYGILFVLGLSSLTVYGLIIAGWSSNSKYAFLGALRSAAQRISYEVSISLSILPVVVLAGSLNFTEIVVAQQNTVWFFSPLLPAAIIFFISIIAETNRTPFDLPEAEAELVAGYNVEYSSIIFARFFLAEYGNIILRSLLSVLRFFGGWSGAIEGILPPALVFSAKGLVFCFLFVLVRASFPRYRYDQLMDIGWKIFLPVSTGFLLFVIGVLSFLDAFPIT